MFESILGIVMFYTWVHSTVIIFKKLHDTDKYENIILMIAFVSMLLFLIGTILGY